MEELLGELVGYVDVHPAVARHVVLVPLDVRDGVICKKREDEEGVNVRASKASGEAQSYVQKRGKSDGVKNVSKRLNESGAMYK